MDKLADFLGTHTGFWFTMALSFGCALLGLIVLEWATFTLSVLAIIVPSIILVRDHQRDHIYEERDKGDALQIG